METASYRLYNNIDWMQEAQEHLYNLAINWDLDNSKRFKTALYGLILKESSNYYYQNHRKHNNLSYGWNNAWSEGDPEYYPQTDHQADKKWLKKRVNNLIKEVLDKDDQELIKVYFWKEKSTTVLASEYSIEQSSIVRRLNRCLQTLKENEAFKILWNSYKEYFI